MVALCALGAAFCYAAAAVVQQRSARQVDARHAGRISLLWSLLHRPVWLAGIAVDVAGYVLQAVALRYGSLALVQALLVSGLGFAVVLAAATGERATRRDLAGSAAIAAGLMLFVLGAPVGGTSSAPFARWAVAGAATLGLSAVFVLAAARAVGPSRRAALYAAAAGVAYGLTGALTKTVVRPGQLDAHLVLTWPPYALAAVSLAGMVVVQTSFQAGPVTASLPVLTAAEPVWAWVLGAALFSERAHHPAPAVVGAVVAALGIVVVARSPTVAV
jgi:drug/metabolite transporter (DMT)-like permease